MRNPKKFLPYGRQFIASAEYRAVRRVLKSPYLTQGPCIEHLEQALKDATDAPYAVAVANGTVALDLAVRAIKIQRGLQNGALAVTTPNTFLASSNALLYNNLAPLFCDISASTYNLCLEELQHLLKKHNAPSTASAAKNTAAIRLIELLLPVHFGGQPVDMRSLAELALKYAPPLAPYSAPKIDSKNTATRLPIIEDAAHALGSHYHSGEKVGCCTYSDACCFSFHPVKTVTTAEGGAITCRDPQLYQLLRMLRSHGICRDPKLWQNARENCPPTDGRKENECQPPLWYYEMQALGHNARLSDVHAALGIAQLRRLEGFARRRRQLAKTYNAAFDGLSWLQTPQIAARTCPHLYVARMDFTHLRRSRNAVMQKLKAQGIGSQVHYIPVPMQPFYRALGYGMDSLKNTQNYYRQALSLPFYPHLKPREQRRVILAIYELAKP